MKNRIKLRVEHIRKLLKKVRNLNISLYNIINKYIHNL